jgi:hypothetical protein
MKTKLPRSASYELLESCGRVNDPFGVPSALLLAAGVPPYTIRFPKVVLPPQTGNNGTVERTSAAPFAGVA